LIVFHYTWGKVPGPHPLGSLRRFVRSGQFHTPSCPIQSLHRSFFPGSSRRCLPPSSLRVHLSLFLHPISFTLLSPSFVLWAILALPRAPGCGPRWSDWIRRRDTTFPHHSSKATLSLSKPIAPPLVIWLILFLFQAPRSSFTPFLTLPPPSLGCLFASIVPALFEPGDLFFSFVLPDFS